MTDGSIGMCADRNAFFEDFLSSRSKEVNFNDCIETPILFAMLPDLHGKKILDIGCGMGQHAKQYSEMGAESVLGIVIEECQEAHISDDMRQQYPALFGGTIHRPEFIFFRCRETDMAVKHLERAVPSASR